MEDSSSVARDEQRLRPVSHLIHKIKDPQTRDLDLKLYEAAFKDYPILGRRMLSSGYWGMSVHLENDTTLLILNWSWQPKPAIWGRSFDVPVLDNGVHNKLQWLLQPYAKPGLTQEQWSVLFNRMIWLGYDIPRHPQSQCGIYQGEPCVLYPWGAEYRPTRWAAPELRPQI